MSGLRYSWGRYPAVGQQAVRCQWPDEVASQLSALCAQAGSTLPYGNGRSYGDSCLAASDQLLDLGALDQLLAVDWQQGVLRASAGMTLAQILELAIPRGWFLPVTPGTRFVTLGGAIGNDVHGKNHHRRGTFGCHVRRFGLLREGQLLECSPTDNPELFAATIGGLGLTGVILWAEISLLAIRSRLIDSQQQRFGNLDDFFALSAELDPLHEYSVAWIDCLASGRQRGRGAFIAGDHAQYGDLQPPARQPLSVPLTPPLSLINPLSLRAFNALYWRSHPAQREARRVAHEPFFYPLDRILHWNRIYGRQGFQQYQCVVPEAVASTAIAALLDAIAAAGQGSFLAVLKRCGDIASPGLLSFPLPGTSLALDFPQQPALAGLFVRLDAIVHEAGGRLYPAKDAHMQGTDFRRAYPAWQQLEAMRDRQLNSRFWQRVTQCNES